MTIFSGIRQLQCILLKIALLLGVEIYQNVTFLNVIEPTSPQQGKCMGSTGQSMEFVAFFRRMASTF